MATNNKLTNIISNAKSDNISGYSVKNKMNKETEKVKNKHLLDNISQSSDNKTKTKNNSDKITKEKIVELFLKNIKGNKFDKTLKSHDGEEGHWLEKLMNIKPNARNTSDLGGYEMKKHSKKISFGDWSAEYLFSTKRDVIKKINKEDIILSKEEFIKTFGNKTKDKENRYSWSGSCVPKYGRWNECGQTLKIDKDNNIIALYSYEKDIRKQNKNDNDKLKGKKICIAVWSNKKMEKHVNSKFNQKGFFICKKIGIRFMIKYVLVLQ